MDIATYSLTCQSHRRVQTRFFVTTVLAAALSTSAAAENESNHRSIHGKDVLRLCLTTNGKPQDEYDRQQNLLKKFTALNGVAVDLTFGNDYQAFDWLQKDEIDAGLLSPLAVFLFHQGSAAEIIGGSGLQPQVEQNYLFFKPAGTSLSGEISAMIRSLRPTQNGEWAPGDNPLGDFDAFLKQVWSVAEADGKASNATDSTVVVMPSHLSTGGFAAPLLHALAFFKMHSKDECARLAANFWRAYFERTAFLLTPSPKQWSSEKFKELAIAGDDKKAAPRTIIEFRSDSESWSAENGWKFYAASKAGFSARPAATPASDWLVLNKAFDRNLGTIEGYEQVKPADLDWAAAPAELEQIRQALRGPGGAQPWTFPFTIAELLRLIARDQETSNVAKLALILPGGGVKACYQSTLIDHLYGNHQLVNRASPSAPGLLVSCVCGNSGGALLGSFVAALRPDKPVSLSSLLWFPGGKPVGSTAIFPYWDLPRWLTVFASCAVFAFVLGLAFFLLKIKPTGPGADTDEESRFRYSVMWACYLALIPVGFKYVNGSFGVEHIPAIAGFIYFFCLCIAIGGDSCFVICKKCAAAGTTTFIRGAFPLALTGTLIALTPVVMRFARPKTEGPIFFHTMPWVSVLYCAGALLLLGGIVLVMLAQPQRFRRHKSIDFLSSVGVLLTIPLVTFVILEGVSRLKMVALLELTISFWWGLLLTSLSVSLAVVCLGISGRKKRDWRRRLYGILEYLWSVHPTQSLNAPRLVRVLMFGFMGWGWWNFVVAPAMYGNDFAKKFFKERVAEFYGVALEKLEDRDADLQTSLIVPATALITGEERYFLFSPESKNDDQNFFKGVVSRRGHDGRWRGFSKQVPLDYLIDFVFASGSPFPIFPAHRITYERTGHHFDLGPQKAKPEWLIDGGYAHNVPIEAASDAGARQVLVVENSPPAPPQIDKPQEQLVLLSKCATAQLPSKIDPGDEPPLTLRSQLISNLPRLLPFMYGRSQSADEQSRAGMFVAALEPSYASSWPLLTDFRSDIVEWMRQAAEADCGRRIGTVQSWGPPRFLRP
jgi:predicted acylesterase/phospholipase RssA